MCYPEVVIEVEIEVVIEVEIEVVIEVEIVGGESL